MGTPIEFIETFADIITTMCFKG